MATLSLLLFTGLLHTWSVTGNPTSNNDCPLWFVPGDNGSCECGNDLGGGVAATNFILFVYSCVRYLFSLWMRDIDRNLFFTTSCASSRFLTVILYKIDFRWRQAEVGPAELGACKATLFKGRRRTAS